jgi:hypothetical protein
MCSEDKSRLSFQFSTIYHNAMVALFFVGILFFGVSFIFSRWMEKRYFFLEIDNVFFGIVLIFLWGAFLLGYWINKLFK